MLCPEIGVLGGHKTKGATPLKKKEEEEEFGIRDNFILCTDYVKVF